MKTTKGLKIFSLVMKALVLLSFFAIANITKSINIDSANAIAGTMTILTIAMYVVDYILLKDEK
jgi:hypothetical protein